MAPPAKGGIARMSSFGEGIQITPFQMASLAAAFANGGTLYYLQYPELGQEVSAFVPRIKRGPTHSKSSDQPIRIERISTIDGGAS